MTDILYDEDNIRVVRLSCTTFGKRVSELTAQFTKGGVGLTRMYSDGKPRKLSVEASEMDALAEAWTAYKADLLASVEAEKQRLISVLEEATKLAEVIGGSIFPVGDSKNVFYDLTFPPGQQWCHCSMTYAHIDLIVERLQNIHADIEREQYMEHHYLGGD